jgi:hypothetical protein
VINVTMVICCVVSARQHLHTVTFLYIPTSSSSFTSVIHASSLPEGEAVMMGWEGPLMVQHAAIICANGGDVLNIGFGLGLVDDAIQVCCTALQQ